MRDGRSPVVLTERTEHLDCLERWLADRMSAPGHPAGRHGQEAVEGAHWNDWRPSPGTSTGRILATGRYIGEGFDDARLDTLFLTLPVSWRGTIAQYAGRLHRLHDGKREVRVYDYADLDVPMLSRMFDRRCRGYEAIGYTILLPASAVPGWPADVPLPSDPAWKRDYSASVRRLIRDGVDAPLAKLFVHAARPHLPTRRAPIAHAARPRRFSSAAWRHLPETRGRFALNATLPIPFDGLGRMEVDLLCAEARLAIELDGDQHLADPDAYRRDRRKDRCSRRTGISCCGSSPKTSGRSWTRYWTRS